VIRSRHLTRHLLLYTFLPFSTCLSITNTKALLEPTSIGSPPSKGSPASMDILEVYITNNGVQFGFIVECRSVPTSRNVRDGARDTEDYALPHVVIPELPWPTPLAFMPALVATVCFYTETET